MASRSQEWLLPGDWCQAPDSSMTELHDWETASPTCYPLLHWAMTATLKNGYVSGWWTQTILTNRREEKVGKELIEITSNQCEGDGIRVAKSEATKKKEPRWDIGTWERNPSLYGRVIWTEISTSLRKNVYYQELEGDSAGSVLLKASLFSSSARHTSSKATLLKLVMYK